MKRDQITRNDFPPAGGGYDRASVDAHLTAVAAWTAALEAQITALEVERDTLRGQGSAGEGQTSATAEAALLPVANGEPAEPTPAPAEPTPAELGPPEPAVTETRIAEPARISAASGDPVAPGDDEVSARLVATRLALEGSEHEEIVARLADAYELDDPESLVEDVLARLA